MLLSFCAKSFKLHLYGAANILEADPIEARSKQKINWPATKFEIEARSTKQNKLASQSKIEVKEINACGRPSKFEGFFF